MSVENLVASLGGDPNYVKFLLVERPRIRSAMDAMPMPLDEEDRVDAFSTALGNSLHHDLIDLETWLCTLTDSDRCLLQDWAENAGRQVFGSARLMKSKKGQRVIQLVNEYGARNDHKEASL
jgi:hypothetical protein